MPVVSTRRAPSDGAREPAHRSMRFGAAASTIEPPWSRMHGLAEKGGCCRNRRILAKSGAPLLPSMVA
jgi:hypothetical protein